MQHQDWTPVVLKKNKTKKETLATPGNYVTVVKTTASKNKQSSTDVNLQKLENDDETFVEKKVTHNLSQQIQKARNDKKMSQKLLAESCNINVSVVASYENPRSEVTIESSILRKLSKVLGVPLALKKN